MNGSTHVNGNTHMNGDGNPGNTAMAQKSFSDDGPVSITYEINGEKEPRKTEHFDFLIVACDPRVLKIADCTEFETEVKDKLTSFTFQTSLFRAHRPTPAEKDTRKPKYAIRFNPAELKKGDGHIYAFRDEGMAFSKKLVVDPRGTYVTTYQLDLQNGLHTSDEETLRKRLDSLRTDAITNKSTPDNRWIDWCIDDSKTKLQPEACELEDYFPHFKAEEIGQGMPWKILNSQGDNNTLYVSSFTCFESVLHCYLYGEMLMKRKDVQGKFPEDKNARFAICGAGPSGILFASQQLHQKGYRNFKIFESSSRFGGKSLTHRRPPPAREGEALSKDEMIPCELGTCYLSPSYAPLFPLFTKYEAGQVEVLDNVPNFRSVIDPDPDVATEEDEKLNGVEFNKWIHKVNGPNKDHEKFKLAVASVKYIITHYLVMGMSSQDPMPSELPNESQMRDILSDLLEAINPQAEETGETAEIGSRELCDKKLSVKGVLEFIEKNSTDNGVVSDIRKMANKLLCAFGNVEEYVKALFDYLDGEVDGEINWEEAIKKLLYISNDVFTKTFAEYLDDSGLEVLKGVFTYAYEVQGYGELRKMPAYLGMVWMTPPILIHTLKAGFGQREEEGLTSVASLGWLKLWEQIVEKDALKSKMVLDAKITEVTRSVRVPSVNIHPNH